MKCDKCKSDILSITKDGHLGERAHCLKCGHVWTLSPAEIAEIRKKEEEWNADQAHINEEIRKQKNKSRK